MEVVQHLASFQIINHHILMKYWITFSCLTLVLLFVSYELAFILLKVLINKRYFESRDRWRCTKHRRKYVLIKKYDKLENLSIEIAEASHMHNADDLNFERGMYFVYYKQYKQYKQ